VLYAATFQENEESPVPGLTPTFSIQPAKLIIQYSPSFADKMTPEQNGFNLAHESAHYLLEHLDRQFKMEKREGDQFDHELWLIATDLAVNYLVTQLTGWNIPDHHMVPVNKEWQGLTTEELYEKLKKIRKQLPKRKCGCCMHGKPAGAPGAEKPNAADEMLKAQLQEAAAQSIKKMVDEGKLQPGNMPGELRELALRFAPLKRPPKWRDLLKRFLIDTSTDCKHLDPSTIFRRRLSIDGLCLPNLSSHPIAKKFVVSIDNSGSVSDEMFSCLCGVIDSVASTLGFQLIIVQHFTSQVMATEKVTHISGVKKITRKADGGTQLEDCDRKAAEHKGQFHVILTDGYVAWLQEYSLPTIIVRTVKKTEEPTVARNLVGSLIADAEEDFE
jgi:predicted metal-dependent peptidase